MPAKKKSVAKKKSKARGSAGRTPSLRELHAMIAALAGNAPKDDSPAGKAMELVRSAYSAESDDEARKLGKEALELDPDCVNAHRLLADRAEDPSEAADLLAKAVAVGERKLGAKFLADFAGELWLHHDARPYMSARQDHALALWAAGRRDESVAVMRETLRLNKGDNQGIRFAIVPALVRLGRADEAAAILAEFAEDLAFASYDRALVEFIRTGDTPETRKLASAARKRNKHIWDLLLGMEEMSPHEPSSYALGSREEADVYIHTSMPAWRSTSGAMTWLRKVAMETRESARKIVGPTAESKARLMRAPKSPAMWLAGTPRLNAWINIEGAFQRPWVTTITHQDKPMVLGIGIEDAEPTSAALWDRLVEAATKPSVGKPHRPARVKLVRGPAADALESHLSECGIQMVRVDSLPQLDGLVKHLSQDMGLPVRDGLLDGAGVTELSAGRFYEAAAQYRRLAPWDRVGYEAAISVQSSRHPGKTWYGVMMGGGGVVFGLVLYPDRRTLRQSFDGATPSEAAANGMTGLTLNFGEAFEISLTDLRAAEKHGWPVFGPEAYPIAYALRPGMKFESLKADELELLEAALRTIPEFVAGHKPDDRCAATFTAAMLTGPVEITLAWTDDRP